MTLLNRVRRARSKIVPGVRLALRIMLSPIVFGPMFCGLVVGVVWLSLKAGWEAARELLS